MGVKVEGEVRGLDVTEGPALLRRNNARLSELVDYRRTALSANETSDSIAAIGDGPAAHCYPVSGCARPPGFDDKVQPHAHSRVENS